jgi:nicotinamidase-related amidase
MTGINTYDPQTTALLCIDFYNDFLSEGGKLWPWVKEMAEEVNLLDNLRTIVRTARELGITVFTLVKGLPEGFHYENGLTVANGEYVLLHGRFIGMLVGRNFGKALVHLS